MGLWNFGTYLNDSCGGSSQFNTCVTVDLAEAQVKQVREDYQALGAADAAGYFTPGILFAGFRRFSAPSTPPPPSGPQGTGIRQVGRHLESADDVLANPNLLAGQNPLQVRAILSESDRWVEGVMQRSRSAPQGGWTFTRVDANGVSVGNGYIQYHPGTHRHFDGAPYWKVTSGKGGTVRVQQ